MKNEIINCEQLFKELDTMLGKGSELPEKLTCSIDGMERSLSIDFLKSLSSGFLCMVPDTPGLWHTLADISAVLVAIRGTKNDLKKGFLIKVGSRGLRAQLSGIKDGKAVFRILEKGQTTMEILEARFMERGLSIAKAMRSVGGRPTPAQMEILKARVSEASDEFMKGLSSLRQEPKENPLCRVIHKGGFVYEVTETPRTCDELLGVLNLMKSRGVDLKEKVALFGLDPTASGEFGSATLRKNPVGRIYLGFDKTKEWQASTLQDVHELLETLERHEPMDIFYYARCEGKNFTFRGIHKGVAIFAEVKPS